MRRTRCFAVCAAVAAIAVTTALRSARAAEDKQAGLIEVLKSDAPGAEKAITCKKLAIYGGKEAVPALAALLADEKLSSWALIALEAIPDPAADEALRDALGKLQGRELMGVINTIGVRRDAQAVQGLAKHLKDADPEVVSCAAAALGHIGGMEVAAILEPCLAGGTPALRGAAAEGCVYCAERLLAAGKEAEAVKLYDAVRKADVPKQRVLEATRGLILARRSDAVPLLLELLGADDKAFYALGLTVARELPGDDVTKVLIDELAKAEPDSQAQLILVLADRGGPGTLPVIVEAAKSGPQAVRLTAIGVLQQVGNASCVPMLLQAAVDDDAVVAAKALQTLVELRDEAVDADLAARLDKAEGKLRNVLIQLAGQRLITAAVPALLKAADDADKEIRAAAVVALGETVELDGVPVLIAKAVKPAAADDANVAAAALKAACVRMADREACAARLAAAMGQAPIEAKVALVEVLGAMGGKTALAAVNAAAKAPEDEVQDVAFRVLGEWMSTDVAPVLLELAKATRNDKYKIRALRGCLRIGRQFDVPAEQRIEMVREAMQIAQREDEKKLAVDVLHRVRTKDGLAMAVSLLQNPAVRAEAADVAVAIGGSLVRSEPAAVAAAMKQVIAVGVEGDAADRAKALLATAQAAGSK